MVRRRADLKLVPAESLCHSPVLDLQVSFLIMIETTPSRACSQSLELGLRHSPFEICNQIGKDLTGFEKEREQGDLKSISLLISQAVLTSCTP